MSGELVQTGGALAVRPDQTQWTPEQAAVLRQSGISDDVTAAELSGFLHLCQRTELDPFSRQIYLIGRKDKRAGRVVFTPQTGIDGYRVVARRATVKSGGTYGYEDTLWCDESGRWRDVWLADSPPAAAKVTVLRDGQRYSAVALFREYVQTGWENKPIGLWGKMPAGQLAKCAEALALRRAFPHDLAGVYTAEEMAQADNPAPVEGATPARQLRAVQPGEADPWATPAAAVQQATADVRAGVADPGRPGLPARGARGGGRRDRAPHLAGRAGRGRRARRTWTQIAEVGRAKAAEPQPAADEVVPGEVVPDQPADDRAAAEAELHAFAEANELPDIAGDFEDATGLPLAEAGPGAIREFLAQLAVHAA